MTLPTPMTSARDKQNGARRHHHSFAAPDACSVENLAQDSRRIGATGSALCVAALKGGTLKCIALVGEDSVRRDRDRSALRR
jgi:hypothetical protein